MSRFFRKRADREIVPIPGVGILTDVHVLEGEEFARFCPNLLVECEGPAFRPSVKDPPKAKTKTLAETKTYEEPVFKTVKLEKDPPKKKASKRRR